jgi:hypothetical protein
MKGEEASFAASCDARGGVDATDASVHEIVDVNSNAIGGRMHGWNGYTYPNVI